MDILDLLRKRSDLSGFVVHFTRRGSDAISPEKNLKSILKSQTIEARTPFGAATRLLESKKNVTSAVITPGHDWLTNPINELLRKEVKRASRFARSPLARIAPFIEQMGSGVSRDGFGYRKEFWWEREWRYRGNFHFLLADVTLGFAPALRIDPLEKFTAKLGNRISFVDPKWSLDKIVAHLSGSRESMTCFDD